MSGAGQRLLRLLLSVARCRVEDIEVTFEGVTVKSLMDFPQVEFRCVGIHEDLAKEMLKAGDLPLDILRERGERERDHG